MISIAIPNRPFSTEPLTGLMLPDGIFEASLGAQGLNAHFANTGATTSDAMQVYIESASSPGIVVQPATRALPPLGAGASRALAWTADVSGAPAGVHRVSFIVKRGAEQARIIKKIFVTRVSYDAATKAFSAETPEGILAVSFRKWIGTGAGCCEKPRGEDQRPILAALQADLARLPRDFRFCLPAYLFSELDVAIAYTPPFAGQYSDLPFEDPWWKVILAVVACLLLIAAAIAESVGGHGTLSSTTGGSVTTDGTASCSCSASGNGTSYVAAGLVAAAAAVATIAAASDDRDPFRRGQDHTAPAAGELTTGEAMKLVFAYPEPVALGRPFSAKLDWSYTRITTGASYAHAASDTRTNQHVLSRYEIEASDFVRLYRDPRWVVRARFFEDDKTYLRGDALFAQCFLVGPAGQWHRFTLHDGGDGWYAGSFDFASAGKLDDVDPRGFWYVYVIAQDVNRATPDMKPEEAAQIIGGMVRTHQLSIAWGGGTCPLTPDGEVQVV